LAHLLSSINPDAAEKMNSGPVERPDVPRPGQVVEYVMRPGHARMGRNRFPAFVMGESRHGRGIDLLVFIDSGDMVDEQMVEKAGPGTEFHCWDWIDDAGASVRGMRGTLTALHQRAGELEERVKVLEAVVLGDFAPPKVSIIHIMQDFENRLRASASSPILNGGLIADEPARAKRGPKKGGRKPAKKAGKRK